MSPLSPLLLLLASCPGYTAPLDRADLLAFLRVQSLLAGNGQPVPLRPSPHRQYDYPKYGSRYCSEIL